MSRSPAFALALWLALACAAPSLADGAPYPDRRREQIPTTPGYIALPYVFSLPGIGVGYGVLGAMTNVGETPVDLAGTFFTGDAKGGALSADSIHLVPGHLILDLGGAYITRATVQTFNQRGMDSSRDDYSLVEVKDSYFLGSRATASFLDRRLEAYLGWYWGSIRIASLRDDSGDVIVEASESPEEILRTWIFGGRLDFTDDYMDPRRGVKFDASLWRSPPSGSGPDYYLTDYSLTGFVPLGSKSTWAFHYFRSDAHVLDPGETDPDALAAELGIDCDALADLGQRQECRTYLENLAEQNRFGQATSLGGFQRLRAYSEGRFSGAHTEMLASELRWNLTDETTPFDIYFVKDIRTAIQLAFFYEIGSVSEYRSELWEDTRAAYGSGIRVVTASGVVYRLDLGYGREGFATSIFFQYPWEL